MPGGMNRQTVLPAKLNSGHSGSLGLAVSPVGHVILCIVVTGQTTLPHPCDPRSARFSAEEMDSAHRPIVRRGPRAELRIRDEV
jgi:hypothetical protein